MKKLILSLMSAAMILCLCTAAFAAEKTEKAEKAEAQETKLQTECPVMGGAIDKKLYIDHEGKRIYVCCGGCVAAIKKDPAKYIKQIEDKGITLTNTPKACCQIAKKAGKKCSACAMNKEGMKPCCAAAKTAGKTCTMCPMNKDTKKTCDMTAHKAGKTCQMCPMNKDMKKASNKQVKDINTKGKCCHMKLKAGKTCTIGQDGKKTCPMSGQ